MTNWPYLGAMDLLQQFQQGKPMPQTLNYQTTLEPMQMLQAYRQGLPVINHVFQQQQQLLPTPLPAYTPPSVPQANGTPEAQQPGYFTNRYGWKMGGDFSGTDSADAAAGSASAGTADGAGGGGAGGK